MYALLLAATDINDNHAIRTLKDGGTPLPERSDLKEALSKWYGSRQTRSRFEGRRLPIYVVAAEGGGVYAGMHAASFLAEIEDLCPGFAHHIFAISGVSGGSVGAAVFTALTKDFDWSKHDKVDPRLQYGCVGQIEGKRRTYFTDAVNAVFDHDLWSPLAAALLFPDFAQWLLPIGIPQFDRARFLEAALEDAYTKGVGESNFLPDRSKDTNRLGEPFIAHWAPIRFPHTPALVLIGTETHSGNRRVIAPFSFPGNGLDFLHVWSKGGKQNGAGEGIKLPLSAAAIVSARFPWVTPAASFDEHGKKVRLVDGAYFENSGAATAVDLIVSMVDSATTLRIADKIQINLIVFNSIGFSDPGRSYGFSEVLEPVRALLGTRSARGTIEVEKAITVLSNLPRSSKVTTSVIKLDLQGYGYPLPLGWRLSDITRHIISYQSGALPDTCPELTDVATYRGITAACAKKFIYSQLN